MWGEMGWGRDLWFGISLRGLRGGRRRGRAFGGVARTRGPRGRLALGLGTRLSGIRGVGACGRGLSRRA